MLDFIRIACAVPAVRVGDTAKNAEDICAYIEKADARQADICLLYTSKVPVFQEIRNFLRLFFKERIGIIPETGMNLGGVAVPQLPTQQSAFHQTTSV